jgi:hypothetical protein
MIEDMTIRKFAPKTLAALPPATAPLARIGNSGL